MNDLKKSFGQNPKLFFVILKTKYERYLFLPNDNN